MNNNALILFAKTPIPNFSKTRLINPFTAEQAAEFYSASLKDVYNTMQNSQDFYLWFGIEQYGIISCSNIHFSTQKKIWTILPFLYPLQQYGMIRVLDSLLN